jgi:hypothetical protein
MSHKTVGSQISFVFPSHKLFFRLHIYPHGSVVKATILRAVLQVQRHQHVTSPAGYFDYMRVAVVIESQMSEDCDITEKLP